MMAPLLAMLAKSGLSLLGSAVAAKGKEFVESKLGVTLPDNPTEKDLAELRKIEFEHEEALQQIAVRKMELELEGEKVSQGAVTERWQADMLSDSWLSKNIRPMVLITLLAVYFFFSFLSGFGFFITQSYIELLAQMLMLVMTAYFAGRSVEKIVDMRERGKS